MFKLTIEHEFELMMENEFELIMENKFELRIEHEFEPMMENELNSKFMVSTILNFWTRHIQGTVISTFVVQWLWKFAMWSKIC